MIKLILVIIGYWVFVLTMVIAFTLVANPIFQWADHRWFEAPIGLLTIAIGFLGVHFLPSAPSTTNKHL